MDVQTDERLLRNIEGYLIELVCHVESIDEVSLVADVLVSVQDALRGLAPKDNAMRDSYPISWKELFLWALIESDKEKLTGLIQAIERAIASRAQELSNSPDHHEERSEMAVANAALLSIKTHKLSWPPVSARDGLR
jgi:hypothetical protein